jgi:colanic acid/amylovoran biosynthesis protein
MSSIPFPGGGPRLCLLGATFATGNLGVSALTDGALQCILHRYPHARVSLLNYARSAEEYSYASADRIVHLNTIALRFSKRLLLRNNVALLLTVALLSRLLRGNQYRRAVLLERWQALSQVDACDMAVALSGGDSFSDIYGMRRFFYVALPQLLVLALGRPLVLLPQTIGPFRSRLCRAVARHILAHASMSFSRDRQGLAYARELLGTHEAASRVRFSPDVAFVVPPDHARWPRWKELFRPRESGCEMVGVNPSGLLAMGGYTRGNMFGLRCDYAELMVHIATRLLADPHVALVLVPHVWGASNPESDETAVRTLFGRLRPAYGRRVTFADGPFDQREAKAIIGGCDFFVGSRMHACIAALSQGVPAAAVAYSRKFAGVMESLGLARLAVDPRELTATQVTENIWSLFEHRAELAAALKLRLPALQASVLSLFDTIPLHSGEGV